MKQLFAIIFFFTTLGFGVEVGLNPDYSLDKEKIKKIYFDGDFEQVQKTLEEFRQHNSAPSNEDLVFVYKFLSVVYAADSKSRDKAESYMYQLLKLTPTVNLIDMFVSENIELIFKNVKSKYEQESEYHEQLSTGKSKNGKKTGIEKQQPLNPKPADSSQPKKKSKAWVYWAAGGGVLAATVVGFLVLSPDENKSSDEKVGEF